MEFNTFFNWLPSSDTTERIRAATLLAQSWANGSIKAQHREEAESAMILLAEDDEVDVRLALSRGLLQCQTAPAHLLLALLRDIDEIAIPIAQGSGQFEKGLSAELIAMLRPNIQIALAKRKNINHTLARSLAKVGVDIACLALLKNQDLSFDADILSLIAKRFAQNGEIRKMLLFDPRTPPPLRQELLKLLCEKLMENPALQRQIAPDTAQILLNEMREKATLSMARPLSDRQCAALASHLRSSGQLNAMMVLRTAIAGSSAILTSILCELSRIPQKRIGRLLAGGSTPALLAAFTEAGLPEILLPFLQLAVQARRQIPDLDRHIGEPGPTRSLIRQILAEISKRQSQPDSQILGLLYRMDAEAARQDAHRFNPQKLLA